MPIIGNLLKKGIELRTKLQETINKRRKKPLAGSIQKKQLFKLLRKAEYTLFGQAYDFTSIVTDLKFVTGNSFYERFKKQIPTYSYNEIYNDWWHKAKD